MLHDDLFHPLANVTHRCNLVSFELGSIGRRRRAFRDMGPSWYGLAWNPAWVASGTPCGEWSRCAAPAKPKSGYHTSNALASAAAPQPAPPPGCELAAQIIAIPPLTWSVWPVT